MRKELLEGHPFEVVHRVFELRKSGFPDIDIAQAVFLEALALYEGWAKRNASAEFAVAFLARDLAAGLLHLETGCHIEEDPVGEIAKGASK